MQVLLSISEQAVEQGKQPLRSSQILPLIFQVLKAGENTCYESYQSEVALRVDFITEKRKRHFLFLRKNLLGVKFRFFQLYCSK